MTLSQPPQINATWPEKCLQPGVTRCNLEHNHRLTGPLRAGRQDPVLPEELLAEHVSALKEWARIPVAVRTQVCVCVACARAGVVSVLAVEKIYMAFPAKLEAFASRWKPLLWVAGVPLSLCLSLNLPFIPRIALRSRYCGTLEISSPWDGVVGSGGAPERGTPTCFFTLRTMVCRSGEIAEHGYVPQQL